MNTHSTALIMHRAILDSGILTRDALRRMRQGMVHPKVMALPENVLRPWQSTSDRASRSRMMVRMNHAFPAFAHSFSARLALMLRAEAAINSLSSSLPTRQLLVGAELDPLPEPISEATDRLAALIAQSSSDELHTLWTRPEPPQPGRPPLFRFRPVVFCAAWRLAWDEQQLPSAELERIFTALALPFASALNDSYVVYARLAKNWQPHRWVERQSPELF